MCDVARRRRRSRGECKVLLGSVCVNIVGHGAKITGVEKRVEVVWKRECDDCLYMSVWAFI